MCFANKWSQPVVPHSVCPTTGCWHAVAAKSSLCSLCPTLYLGKAAWLAVSVVQLLPLVRAVGHVAHCFTHCHTFFPIYLFFFWIFLTNRASFPKCSVFFNVRSFKTKPKTVPFANRNYKSVFAHTHKL